MRKVIDYLASILLFMISSKVWFIPRSRWALRHAALLRTNGIGL